MAVTRIERLLQDDEGAVTVDWVVITAAMVGLALAVVMLVQAGATDTSEGLGASLGAANVPTVTF